MDVTLPVLLPLAALLGLCIGSFLTVVIARVPEGRSIVAPPSACDSCGTRLGPADLVPVFSWLALRGRCRHCGAKIGHDAVLVELATAGLFAAMAWRFGWSPELVGYLIFGAALVALTAIDLRTMTLPRQIIYVATGLTAAALAVAAVALGEPERIWMTGVGASIGVGLMGTIYVLSKGGMGDGDVRLSLLLGAALGWLNPGLVLIGLFFGFILGTLGAVPMVLAGRAGRKTAIPFGPYLAAGAVVAIFVGQQTIDLILVR
jgi:leader peptidase (prepilin peptidase) / N-methyltransferase